MNQNNLKYLVGNGIKSLSLDFDVFDDYIISFFDELSKYLFKNTESKKYPDIVTFAFYIRKANVLHLKDKFNTKLDNFNKLGRGIVFHVAPSNVPINFAYSLFSSLICGNKNIVKVSSKEFKQVDIVCKSICEVLSNFKKLEEYTNIIRYNNEKEITDYFSALCDVRVIWGGDNTIDLIKQSKTKPRCREVFFADRYSLLVVDGNYYKKLDEKTKSLIAHNVYNDTYLSDQNACTSPRLICFIGDSSINDEFYLHLQDEVKKKYEYKPIFSSNKLFDASRFAVEFNYLNPKIIFFNNESFIMRIKVDQLDDTVVNFAGNTGLFVECSIGSILELESVCSHDSVQTISYIGDKSMFDELLDKKLIGIDRIVPAGKTMDFDLVWDGYNLIKMFTRNIQIL